MRKKYSARQSVHNFGSSKASVLSVKERGRSAHGTMEKWAGRPPSFAKPTQVGGSPTLL